MYFTASEFASVRSNSKRLFCGKTGKGSVDSLILFNRHHFGYATLAREVLEHGSNKVGHDFGQLIIVTTALHAPLKYSFVGFIIPDNIQLQVAQESRRGVNAGSPGVVNTEIKRVIKTSGRKI